MSGAAPPDLVILTRKKIGHYWHVTGLVNGEKKSYRMPAHYLTGDEAQQEAAMKDGLQIIDGHEARR